MTTRFDITDVPIEESPTAGSSQGDGDPAPKSVKRGPGTTFLDVDNVDQNQLTITSEGNLALYEDELHNRPTIATFLSGLVKYDATTPNPKQRKGKARKKKKQDKLGTLMGVYLPCLQNILGVILFLRMTWIVGIAGVGEAFLIVFLCCSCTFLTALSLSAIATNGVVPAGGPYFLVSRNLGPEVGGAVGLLFYLGTTFATSLYVLGAIELLLTYIAPQMVLFGTITGNPVVLFNNMRVYGTILLLLMSLVVFIGVKYVNLFGSLCLGLVIIAVASIYAGALNPVPRVRTCTLDGVALESVNGVPLRCNEYLVNRTRSYCGMLNASTCDAFPDSTGATCCNASFTDSRNNATIFSEDVCFEANPDLIDKFNGTRYLPDGVNWDIAMPVCKVGIPGITASSLIVDNTKARYLRKGQVYTQGGDGGEGGGAKEQGVGTQVRAELTVSFLVLLGIFFPSVTGIMAGSNRSGDLKDAQKSIPIGTIAAIITTTIIYLTCVLFFGATIEGFLLRDQLGYAQGLPVSLLAWPTKWVILIGALLSTTGAGLQSLTGAPRLLQAIATDNLIPVLSFFKRTGLNGEPSYALFLTTLLAECGVLIASLDLVAPILTMFFLMLYLFVNVACTLQSLLRSPSWRPRFRYYHWTTSLLGALLCLILMFLSSWYYALAALVITIPIYKYIEYRGAEKEWGDGIRGLSLQAARYSLLRLEEGPTVHTKNWRPQVLVLCKLDSNLLPSHSKILSFASQLKAGKGLTLIFSVIKGQYTHCAAEVAAAKECLKRAVNENKIKGFCSVVVSQSTEEGLSQVIQSAGLGVMRHNTVVVAWPDSWRRKKSWRTFTECVRVASSCELAVMVPKGINWYPSNIDRMRGSIDIWWVVHDGGLLMLLPFLLRQHKVWRHCNLRIFAVAQIEDDSIQMKKDLERFLYQLRIAADVYVMEMPDSDISAYTYERTLVMEQRNDLLKQMKLSKKERKGEVQHLISKSFVRRSDSVAPSVNVGIVSDEQSQLVSVPAVTVTSPHALELDDLSIEPRVAGKNVSIGHSKEVGKEEEQEEEEEVLRTGGVVGTDGRDDDASSCSGSSVPEESVCTPLLETPPQHVSPPPPDISLPRAGGGGNIFEQMWSSDEVPLGGTANTLRVTEPQEENLRRMNTSVKLNELIVTKSHDSALVIINLPGPPRKISDEENYMEFLDVLTEGLDRVLMVRGGGREVITIYS